MEPKGKLLIGGAEERDGKPTAEQTLSDKKFEVLSHLLPSSKTQGRIEVVTCASQVPREISGIYQRTFDRIGFSNVGFLHADNRRGAAQKEWEKRLEQADTVFLTGGDQAKLATVLGGSQAWDTIEQKYKQEKGFVVAGTSAGAMVLSSTMILGGGTCESLLSQELKLGPGLGLLDHCVVDTHFVRRGRFARLAHALLLNPRYLGVGLGEDSALLIEQGFRATCLGTGMVVLMDASKVSDTNITEVDDQEAIFAIGLRGSLLIKGCRIDLNDRSLECITEKK